MGKSDECPHVDKERDPTPFFDPNNINFDAHRLGWTLSGICAFIATVIAFFLVYKHMRYYTKPDHQRYIIRVVLMVPIYAIISWLSYRFYQQSTYYVVIRDCYEAFVMASFFILLLRYMGDTDEDQKRSLRTKSKMKYTLPFCCWTYNPAGTHFLQVMKWSILQYVVIRPITTLLAVIFEYHDTLCEASFSPVFANFWLQSINFISVSVAMFFLITFYITIKDLIKEHRPFFKFLCVKLVVFFSFWQMICLMLLSDFGVIKETKYWTPDNIANGINAILITFEMIFFALLHIKAFPYRIYRPSDRKTTSMWIAFWDSLNPMDFVREIWSGILYGYSWMRGRPLGPKNRYLDLELALGITRARPIEPDDIPFHSTKGSSKSLQTSREPSMAALDMQLEESVRILTQHGDGQKTFDPSDNLAP